MEKKYVYPKGIRTFDKGKTAPDFIVGSITITDDELIEWLKSPECAEYKTEYNGKKQTRLTILRGKDGKLNLQVDTWKPSEKSTPPANTPKKPKQESVLPDSDLPFVLFVG